MLGIDIIEKKKYRTNEKTGEKFLDLVTASWNTKTIQYRLKNIAIVTDETEMRPDLVSLSYQGTCGALGSLLKLNGISNPLSVKSGEILAVPGEQMVNDLFEKGPATIGNQKQKAKTFRRELQDKISQVSAARMEYLNSKNISNLAQTPLPPNILQEGEQQILVEGGKLIFGPDIGQCKTKTTKNMTITDMKSKMAQKNIFNRQ